MSHDYSESLKLWRFFCREEIIHVPPGPTIILKLLRLLSWKNNPCPTIILTSEVMKMCSPSVELKPVSDVQQCPISMNHESSFNKSFLSWWVSFTSQIIKNTHFREVREVSLSQSGGDHTQYMKFYLLFNWKKQDEK